jgi:hypothetical protein
MKSGFNGTKWFTFTLESIKLSLRYFSRLLDRNQDAESEKENCAQPNRQYCE